MNIFLKFLRAVIVILIISAGAGIGWYLIATKPVAQRRTPEPPVIRVEAMDAVRDDNQLIIGAMGTVQAAREVDISSQVAGRVLEADKKFVPGGRFAAGEKILKIDPVDYELLIKQRTADLEKAKANFRIEQGQQAIARRGYELLGESISEEDEDFVLRRPQLSSIQADIDTATARLEQAKTDLARTDIYAPFNCLVVERYVDEGSSVNLGGRLVSLVGTDEFWVELSVPTDSLRWIQIPSKDSPNGSKVRIYCESLRDGSYREGIITGIKAELETTGRMARVMVSVKDPLNNIEKTANMSPLIIGAFVSVDIIGIELKNSIKIPRDALRDGKIVWICRDDNTLELREVQTIYKDSNFVYLKSGINDGEVVITSDIAAAVDGIKLFVTNQNKGIE